MRISAWRSDVCSSDLALISASVRSSTFATSFELTATDRKWLHRWLQPGSPSQAQLSLSRLARSTVLCPALASSWKPPPCRCPTRAKSPVNLSSSLLRSISINFDHRFKKGYARLTRRSSQPLKRKNKIRELGRGRGAIWPYAHQLATPRATHSGNGPG